MGNTSKNNLTEREIFYFQQRNRNRLFQAVVAFFAGKAQRDGLTKSELAKSLGKDPAQITRWFSGPSNWTLDTVSDLLLAMDCELDYEVKKLNLRDDSPCATFRDSPTQARTGGYTQEIHQLNIPISNITRAHA